MELAEKEGSDPDNEFFGVTMDITNGGIDKEELDECWVEGKFRTGPMAMTRKSWEQIRAARDMFCTFDEYNWDWSVIKLWLEGKVSRRVVTPSKIMVHHIGAEGMHIDGKADTNTKWKLQRQAEAHFRLKPFHAEKKIGPRMFPGVNVVRVTGNGGWGHPRDHEHCLNVMGDEGKGGKGGVQKLFNKFVGGKR
uniref:Alpha-1,6-mannosyl-glycoprotein 2-beta-N-acetylglucosaminyltransferase n=1 Tax=Pseudictyota dubia TaxID=2749911 RepID=A0A7R9WJ56_9STRA